MGITARAAQRPLHVFAAPCRDAYTLPLGSELLFAAAHISAWEAWSGKISDGSESLERSRIQNFFSWRSSPKIFSTIAPVSLHGLWDRCRGSSTDNEYFKLSAGYACARQFVRLWPWAPSSPISKPRQAFRRVMAWENCHHSTPPKQPWKRPTGRLLIAWTLPGLSPRRFWRNSKLVQDHCRIKGCSSSRQGRVCGRPLQLRVRRQGG